MTEDSILCKFNLKEGDNDIFDNTVYRVGYWNWNWKISGESHLFNKGRKGDEDVSG